MSIEFSVNSKDGAQYYQSDPIPAGSSVQFIHQQSVEGKTTYNFFEATCNENDDGGLIRRMVLSDIRIIPRPEGPTLEVNQENFLYEDTLVIENGEAGQRSFEWSGDTIVFKHSRDNIDVPNVFKNAFE